MRKVLLLVLAVLFVSGCVRTTVSSFTDPKFAGRSSFNSVMVLGGEANLEQRKLSEAALYEALGTKGVRVEKSLSWLPPTRNYTPEQMAAEIKRSGVATLLIVTASSKDVTESYVPPTYVPGQTYGTVNVIGNTAYMNTYTTPGYTYGGYTISKPQGTYRATLLSVATGETIWQADLSSRGNAFSTFEDLAISASKKTAAKLIEDGIF